MGSGDIVDGDEDVYGGADFEVDIESTDRDQRCAGVIVGGIVDGCRDMTGDKETTISNFKVVMAKQKMLISFMTSYSYIIQQLSQCPSENAMTVDSM
jgi:hypothetical protein